MLNMLRGCYHCTSDLTDFGPDPQTEVLQSFLGGPALCLPPSSPTLPSPGQTKATLQPGWELGRVKGVGGRLMVNFHPDQLPPHGCTEFVSAGVELERASGGESGRDKGKGKPTLSSHSAHLNRCSASQNCDWRGYENRCLSSKLTELQQ